jgi:anti-anti-sigma regulatory factor
MAMTTKPLSMDEGHFMLTLRAAGAKLNVADGEAILDFSAVRRVDSKALHALEEFAQIAGEKGIKVVLRGVNIDVYKVFKLVKLTRLLSFEYCPAQSPRSY